MFDASKRCVKRFENKIWLSSPTMHGPEIEYVKKAYETNWMSTVGENINEIEKEISSYVGCQYAVALSSGTASLHLAVRLAGEHFYGQRRANEGALQGHKVFCSDMTFDATVNPVAYENGEAVFIDTEYDTWNMDPAALEKAFEIYPDVKIVVIAHLYGTPGKIDELKAICDRHGALIVEDAAESLGAEYRTKQGSCDTGNLGYGTRRGEKDTGELECGCSRGSRDVKEPGCENDRGNRGLETTGSGAGREGVWWQTGSFGDYNCISFNGNKIITGSAGGMFLTNSREDAEKVRKWSTQARENAPWYQHEELGYNYRMSNVIAGVVRGQIPYLEEHIRQKREIYFRYKNAFEEAGLPVEMNPYDEKNSEPNFWLSCLLLKPEALCRQVRGEADPIYIPEAGKTCPTEILEALASVNAEGRPIWKPMHLQPIYRMNPFVTREGNGRANTNAYISGKKDAMGVALGSDGLPFDVGVDLFQRGLCLPSDNKMTVEEQERVIEVVKRCFR